MPNRRRFGGTASDWVFTPDTTTGDAEPLPSTAVTFWTALTGGIQYQAAPFPGGADDGTGLTDAAGNPIAGLTTDSNGFLPDNLMGPDSVWAMAADASGGSGPRRWIVAHDIGDELNAVSDAAGVAGANATAALGILAGAPMWVFANPDLSWPQRPVTTREVVWANTVGAAAPPSGSPFALAGDLYLGP